MGVRSENVKAGYQKLIKALNFPSEYAYETKSYIDSEPALQSKRGELIDNLEKSTDFQKKTGYLPIKVDDVCNFCQNIIAFDARTLLIQLRTDPMVSSRRFVKASRLTTRAFRNIQESSADGYSKFYDLFRLFSDAKEEEISQFDFELEEQRYVVKKLLEYYGISCDFIPGMEMKALVAEYSLSGADSKNNANASYELGFSEKLFETCYVELLEEIYSVAILLEKLMIKLTKDKNEVTFKIPELARIFQTDPFTIRRWLDVLEKCRLIVKNPFKEAYGIALDEKRLDLLENMYEKKKDESDKPLEPSKYDIEKIDFSSPYKYIVEGKDIEESFSKIHEEASSLINRIADVSLLLNKLRQRDALMAEKEASIAELQQAVEALQADNISLRNRNSVLSADNAKLKEQNRNMSHNVDMLKEHLAGRLEEAMSESDQKIIETVEKYRNRVMTVVKAEIQDDRRINQIKNDFIKLNMDISRTTHINVSEYIPAISKDCEMTEEDFILDQKD